MNKQKPTALLYAPQYTYRIVRVLKLYIYKVM